MRASGLLGSASFTRRLVHLSRLPKVVRVVGTGLGASLVLGACNLPTFAINKTASEKGGLQEQNAKKKIRKDQQ